jgi:hypothetical protein
MGRVKDHHWSSGSPEQGIDRGVGSRRQRNRLRREPKPFANPCPQTLRDTLVLRQIGTRQDIERGRAWSERGSRQIKANGAARTPVVGFGLARAVSVRHC